MSLRRKQCCNINIKTHDHTKTYLSHKTLIYDDIQAFFMFFIEDIISFMQENCKEILVMHMLIKISHNRDHFR